MSASAKSVLTRFVTSEAAFADALLNPALPPPVGLPAMRFAVYRNNVAASLIRALETRFPAVRRIVGDDFFRGLARAFAMAHPPRSPVMMAFGDGFADFIGQAPGLDDLAYLADVARLEAARTRAYHAADAEPLGRDAFAAIDPAALSDLTIALHPSIGIVRSAHPIVTIWAMNAGETELGLIHDWSAEDALVMRPEMHVMVRRLPAGGAAFLLALGRGACFADAAQEAATEAPTFDLTQNLVGLIEAGVAIGLSLEAQTNANHGADA